MARTRAEASPKAQEKQKHKGKAKPKDASHEKGIYKRGDIYWIAYAGLDGRTIRQSTKSTSIKDARVKLTEAKYTVNQGKEPEITRIKNHAFKDLADEYKKWAEGRQNSAKVKEYVINSHLAQFNAFPLRRFNTALAEQFQTELIGKEFANAYVNKVINILKHMFSKAVEWEMVEEDVLRRVRKVRMLRENKRLRYLTFEECSTLIEACDKHLKPIVITALNTGMRRGEILGLKRSNLDLTNGFILLDKTKNGERREIPINATVKAIFQAAPRRLDSQYVFHHPGDGTPYTDIKHSFTKACNAAKLTDLHFHDLRHTFASHLVMSGVDLATVKELLGHKDIKMTLRYAHLAPSHKMKAVDILNDAFQASTSQKLHNLQIVEKTEALKTA